MTMNAPSDLGPKYAWWRAAAYEGKFGPIHEGQPELGYFKLRRSGDPVCIELHQPIDPETGELDGDEDIRARVGTAQSAQWRNAEEIWTWVASNPVRHEDYKVAYDTGQWPGDLPNDAMAPAADSFEGLVEQIEIVLTLADAVPEELTDKLQADTAANIKDRLKDLWDALEALRVEEKRPYDEGAKAVQDKFKPELTKASVVRDSLSVRVGRYLGKIREAAMKAAREAAREAGGDEAAEAIVAPVVRVGGASGRKTGVTMVKKGLITDWDKAYMAVREDGKVREAIDKAIQRLVKAGAKPEGVSVTEEASAR